MVSCYSAVHRMLGDDWREIALDRANWSDACAAFAVDARSTLSGTFADVRSGSDEG